ncbi:unnamed protein product [Fusarium graminearum]|nr:unnamed protein product [Fusarium graminearum]
MISIWTVLNSTYQYSWLPTAWGHVLLFKVMSNILMILPKTLHQLTNILQTALVVQIPVLAN